MANLFNKKTGRFGRALLTAAAALLAFSACSHIDISDGGKDDPVNIDGEKTASGVTVNEVVSDNARSYVDEVYGSADWVELINAGSSKQDISGWKLGDSSTMENCITFPQGTSLKPGETLCVLCVKDFAGDAGDKLVAPFGISKSGEKLYLSDGKAEPQCFEVPSLPADFSWARMEDGSYGFSNSPTYGKDNEKVYATVEEASDKLTAESELSISELVRGSEGWVEIVNISDHGVDLSQYTLTDDAANPGKWRFPQMELERGGCVVVELTGEADGPLYASFKISSTEEGIYLYNSAGRLASRLEFAANMPKGISAVSQNGGTAYTAYTTKGGPNTEDTFPTLAWTELDLTDPSAKVVINEVLADNKYSIVDSYGDRSDWVELMNISDEEVDLSYYYLSDDPDDPLKWQLPNVSIQPHKHQVIFLSGRDSTENEIHAPFKLSEGESIYLTALQGMKMDRLEIPEGINPNVSVGRGPGNAVLYYAAPTPGGPNSTHGTEKYADAGGFNARSVYISEVCAVTKPRTDSNDWIELYNGGDTQVLSGWSITDDIDKPGKFTFGEAKIAAGDYVVLSSAYLGFSFSNSGETVYLLDNEGAVRDVFATGMTQLGMTSGREAGTQTGDRVFFTSATCGYKNASPLAGCAAEPTFSQTTLYASSPFELAISCSTPGAEIRYTTDGSTPTRESKSYSGAVKITENTVIKARAFRDGLAASPVATQTFIFASPHTMPVVCLSMSKDDYGRMYVARSVAMGGVEKGEEVACTMEYFVDGRLAISSGAGVRVSGASTALYPQKSLGLYFRAGYGRSTLDYPLFNGCKTSSFRSLVLRNSGQDAGYARIRDSLLSKVAPDFNIDYAAFRPVIVYINGNYRGIYDLKENLNEDYLVAHRGAVRSRVETARRNGKMIAGTKEQFKAMLEMCRTLDFSKQENFDRLAQIVDTDSMIDYLILRTYFYDGDMYNQKYWHTTDNKVKWRAILYDSDYAMFGNSPAGNILPLYFNPNGVQSAHGFTTQMDIFCALNQNKQWREEFITRYIYAVKYLFDPDRLLPVYDALVNQYKPEMKAHISRWGMPSSYDKWQTEVSSLRKCLEQRPAYALKYLKNFYGLSDSAFAEYERAAQKLANG